MRSVENAECRKRGKFNDNNNNNKRSTSFKTMYHCVFIAKSYTIYSSYKER